MLRITEKDLEAAVTRINFITKSPPTCYQRDDKGKLIAQVGNFHISASYGGYALHRIVSGGGIADAFRRGHVPKRQLYEMIHAFIAGLDTQN